MSLTPLGYFASVEAHATALLPAQPGGREWRFQRFMNFHEQSGSLQVLLARGSAEPQLLGVLHVRQASDETGAFLKGWMQAEGMENREPFVIHSPGSGRVEDQTRDLVQRWVGQIEEALTNVNSPAQQVGLPPPAEGPAGS